MFLNIEIKARCAEPDRVRTVLQQEGARFVGTDQQTDTYFNVTNGRLKLREGNIENALIYYERSNQPGAKPSDFTLIDSPDPATMKSVLIRSLGIKVVVKKNREIYYIDNVKFHIDDVEGLGSFVEIEAGNKIRSASRAELEEQCKLYINKLLILPGDFVSVSYSDMLIDHNPG